MPLTGLPADVSCVMQGVVNCKEFLSYNVSGDKQSGVTTIVLHFGSTGTDFHVGGYPNPNVFSPPQSRRKAPCQQRRDFSRWNQRYGQTSTKSTRLFQNSTPVNVQSPFSKDPPLLVDSGVEESRSSQDVCTPVSTKANVFKVDTPSTTSPSETANRMPTGSVVCNRPPTCDVSNASTQTIMCDSFNNGTPSEIQETHSIEDDATTSTNDDSTQFSDPLTWELSDENIRIAAHSQRKDFDTMCELGKFAYYTLQQDRDSLSQACRLKSRSKLKRVVLDPSDSNNIIAETDQLVVVFNDCDRLLQHYFLKNHVRKPQETQWIHYLSSQPPCDDNELVENMQEIVNNLCMTIVKVIQSV